MTRPLSGLLPLVERSKKRTKCVLGTALPATIGALVLLLAPVALPRPRASTAQNREHSIPELVKSSVDAVVLIVVSDASGKEVKQGSGFIVSPDGRILTNLHVVKGGRSGLVKLSNGSFFDVDGVLATSEQDDLALIKVGGRNLPFLPLGDSDKLSVGEKVVAVGSPLGLQNTVSDGIVSAIREQAESRKWIQTTAPASPGNSGGPLMTLDGSAVGVVTFRASAGENLNFAAPINAAKSLLASAHGIAPLGGLAGQSPTAIGGLWTSMTTGNDLKIRVDGDYIYVDRTNWPAQLRDTEAFVRSELKKSGDRWVGKTRMRTPCNYDGRLRWCNFELDIEITSLTDSRIEGRAQADVSFDCGTCQIKKLEWKPFVWIPKD